jgi:GntR family transcriptional regulator
MFPFEVDTTTDIPLWVQLRKRIAYLINSGYYRPGEQLPTVRGLASEISINYNTVNKAYLSLLNDGYIVSTRGRGVFVRDFDAVEEGENSQAVDALLDDCIQACRELGLSLNDIEKSLNKKLRKLKKDGTEKLHEKEPEYTEL